MVKTLVALYEDAEAGHQVVEALLDAGFSGDDISLLVKRANIRYADSPEVGMSEGVGFGALVGVLVGVGSALVPGIGPLIGAGPLAIALTAGVGAATGALTGGITARLLDLGLNEEELTFYKNGLRSGSTVVSVTTHSQWIEWAERIMTRYQPLKLEQRNSERQWSKFEVDEEESQNQLKVLSKKPSSEPESSLNSGVGIYDYNPRSFRS